MKILHRFIQYLFVVLQACFAGLLLGQLVNLVSYHFSWHWLLYVAAVISATTVVMLFFYKKQVQQYLFRHVSFSWIYFFSVMLYGITLFFLLVPVWFHAGDGYNGRAIMQAASLVALTVVLLESHYLEKHIFQKVYADLFRLKIPAAWVNCGITFIAMAFAFWASHFVFISSEAGFQDIFVVTLLPGGALFALLLLAKMVQLQGIKSINQHSDTAFSSPVTHDLPLSMLQQDSFYLEEALESKILEASPGARANIWAKIRQIPLIDKLPLLEQLQANHLKEDADLAATVLFLKNLRQVLLEKGAHYDIDVISDLMEVKAIIRQVIVEGKPMLIQKLLSDNRPEVRKAAIFASVHFQETGFIPVLVNLLKEPEYSFTAKEALYKIGDRCIPFLRSAKYRNKNNSFFIAQCLELVERYRTDEANAFLIEMLNEPQKRFQYKAALALLKQGYTLSNLHKTQVQQFIETLIGLVAIQREILISLADHEDQLLKEALKEEQSEKMGFIADLLKGFLPQSVHYLIKRSDDHEEVQNVFSLYVLVDLYFPLVLRSKCKILLGSDYSKNIAPELQPEYPNQQVHFRYEIASQAIAQILKLDYGQIGYWLRACALKQLGKLNGDNISFQMLAEVFNGNSLLQETACEVLYDLNYDYYFLYMQRLAPEQAKLIKHKIELYKTLSADFEGSENYLLHQQIIFLKSVSIFRNCAYEHLARHIEQFQLLNFPEGRQELNFDPYKPNGYWIVYQGAVTFYDKGEKIAKAAKGDVVDLSFLTEADVNVVTIKSKNLLQVYFIEYSTLNNLYLASVSCQSTIIRPEVTHAAKHVMALDAV